MRRVGGARHEDARGHRQRAAARGQGRISQLYRHLVESWAFGLTPATVVQRIAAACVRDHATAQGVPTSPPDVVQLGDLGTGGQDPQRCHTELGNLVQKSHDAPAAHHFPLPMKCLKRRLDDREVLMLLKH